MRAPCPAKNKLEVSILKRCLSYESQLQVKDVKKGRPTNSRCPFYKVSVKRESAVLFFTTKSVNVALNFLWGRKNNDVKKILYLIVFMASPWLQQCKADTR